MKKLLDGLTKRHTMQNRLAFFEAEAVKVLRSSGHPARCPGALPADASEHVRLAQDVFCQVQWLRRWMGEGNSPKVAKTALDLGMSFTRMIALPAARFARKGRRIAAGQARGYKKGIAVRNSQRIPHEEIRRKYKTFLQSNFDGEVARKEAVARRLGCDVRTVYRALQSPQKGHSKKSLPPCK